MEHQVQEWVEGERSRLAKRAWQFVERQEIKGALVGIDPTALRTLLVAASNATCIEEIFIVFRYQQGRDRDRWKEDLVAALLKELKDEVVGKSRKDHPLGDRRDRAEALLIASFLGFLVRLHRYHYEAARPARR